jgi:hypothetical protein
MTELSTEEMTEISGGQSLSLALPGSGLQAISVGNVALALNVGVSVLSGNGGTGGLNMGLGAIAEAGTISF